MISKNEAKYIQSLSHKKNRESSGCFIAETPKLVNELLKEGFVFQKIYTTDASLLHIKKQEPLVIISRQDLARISNLQTPNNVVAVVQQKKIAAIKTIDKIVLVLDGIQDPGNAGTIIRTADWFGINTIIASENTVDEYNPKVVQATMGSITRVQVHYTNLELFLQQQVSVPVYGAFLTGHSIYNISKIKQGIIIIGSEASGISTNLLPYIKHPVTIPSAGSAESLNAAVATGIILSHLAGTS